MEQATTERPIEPPSRTLKWWHVVLAVVVGLVVIGVITEETIPKHGPSSSSGKVSVTSSTGSNADIDVNHNGDWSQMNDQNLPWSETVGFGIVSVAAQNKGGHGSITCTITNSDGTVRDTETSTGPYAEVSCNTTSGNSGTAGNSSTTGNSGATGNS